MRRYLPVLALTAGLAACLSGCIDSPTPTKRQPTRTTRRPPPPKPELRQCLAALTAQNAIFTPVEDRYFSNSCSTVGTVKLVALNTDNATVTVTNLGPVTCATATPFAAWARFGVDRAAQQILGSRIVKIETFGSYSCRNVAGTARRSGHATANAIDVSAFVLGDGRRISVLNDWNGGSPEARSFLRVVHDSACKRFGTTLGPGYNAAHANHFHLEADGANFCR
ncbi:extensin-like protein [Novosphingobium sp. Rr 2-17]|uniref:extensin family protein n=1 Tax=Novosphingobium sp. Rr 2-17 TaxID=555793 RepID=UPI000269AB1A|nr:extensin family protein [Novosphingobium sp. Rr 2-17]EIZ80186.1 extensin-like protein [Novosphingobium sp. Rr 2-17]